MCKSGLISFGCALCKGRCVAGLQVVVHPTSMNKQTVEQVNKVAPTYQVSKVRPFRQHSTRAWLHGLTCEGMHASCHQEGASPCVASERHGSAGDSERPGISAGEDVGQQTQVEQPSVVCVRREDTKTRLQPFPCAEPERQASAGDGERAGVSAGERGGAADAHRAGNQRE